jgi:hypothetical protein
VIEEDQYRGVEVYLDADGCQEATTYTPPGYRPPPKFKAAWRVTIGYRERHLWSSDTTYVVRVDSLRQTKRSDGRQRCYVWYVVRRGHEDYALRYGGHMRGAVLEIAQRAVESISPTIRCCVKHVLIGRYDGTECVGLRSTASAPGTSSASEHALEDSCTSPDSHP